MSYARWVILCLAALLACASGAILAQPPAQPAPAKAAAPKATTVEPSRLAPPAAARSDEAPRKLEVPALRRIFIPSEEIKSRNWKEPYPPVDAREFEQMLERIEASVAPGRVVRIEKIDLDAKLASEDLLVGTLSLRLARASDAPSMLDFAPCSLALGPATWKDQNNKAAVLGVNPQNRCQLLVDGSQLVCSFSLRGQRTASGAVNFPLELPACSISTLAVAAPANQELLADHGILSRTAVPGGKGVRWTIELGGQNRVNLRAVSDVAGRERRPLTLLRQSLTYEFAARGINLVAQLKLDVHGEPLDRVAVDLDPALRLVAARYGELDVPWSATLDPETHISHVMLQLPEPITGTGRVIKLRALVPLEKGKPWRLPGLRPEGMSWQEGTATLLISSAFVLEQLSTEGCRQSRIAALPGPAAGESIEIQCYRPTATIEVFLAEPSERIKLNTATAVEVGSNEITGRAGVQVSLGHGERRSVQLAVGPQWIIDGVDDAQTSRPLDWELEESGPDTHAIKVRLGQPLSAANSVRLVVRGRRALPTGASFEAAHLQMLLPRALEQGGELISVVSAEGFDLRWNGSEELKRRDPAQVKGTLAELFGAQGPPPGGMLFEPDAAFVATSISFERRKPNYTADIRVEAVVQPGLLSETYTIACVPESTRLERLLAHFSHEREVPLEWSLAGGTSGEFSARRLTEGEQGQLGLPSGGEAWEVNLRLTRPGPFEVRAVRSVPFTSELPLALASVAEATTQRGTLAIRALGDAGLEIKNRRLAAVPAELLDADRIQTVRGAYHYQPTRDGIGAEPAVSIAPAAIKPAETGAWVWLSRVDSRCAQRGTCVHWATFQIQTAGQQQVMLSLPEHAQLQSGWLDNQRLSLNFGPQGAPIRLPAGRAFATLALYYTSPGILPTIAGQHTPHFPTLNIPTLTRQWSVSLPPGYEVVDRDSRFAGGPLAAMSWDQRLFGPLGTSGPPDVFNPLNAADWKSTFGGAQQRAGQQLGEQFAEALAALHAQHAGGEGLSWGQLLAEAQSQSSVACVVDADSLAGQNLFPRTRVDLETANTELAGGLELLRQANLVLLADSRTLLVTTVSRAAVYGGHVAQSSDGVILPVTSPVLSDVLRSAFVSLEPSRLQTVESWRAMPEPSTLPWTAAHSEMVDYSSRGWTTYTLQFGDHDNVSVRMVHRAAMHALAWAIFITFTGLGLWQSQRHPLLLIGVLALSAALALLLPGGYALPATAAVLAGIFCLVLRLMRTESLPKSSDKSRSAVKLRSSIVQRTATLILFGLILHAMSGRLASQPPEAKPLPVAAALEAKPEPAPAEIYIPVDAEQKLAGDVYYVPERLYRSIARLAAEASGQPQDWLLGGGQYKATLARRAGTRVLEVTHVAGRFDLQVFQANMSIRLPFGRGGKSPVVAARLDGAPIALNWSASGNELSIGPLAAERYRLELDFQPAPQSETAAAGFDLPVPALASASLELTLPPDAPAIELPTARGQTHVDAQKQLLTAQLGSNDSLTVRWPTALGMETTAPNLEVEELVWVKVAPGTTVLDARFKYRVLSGNVRQIRLLADPRLRLLPSLSNQAVIAAIPGDPQRIELELNRDVTDQVVIDLSFLLTSTSGVGNLRLPRLESVAARPAKRWLAVTVDPALETKIQAGEDTKILEVADFMTAWGSTDERPQAAYGIPRGDPMWNLSTHPHDPQATVEQTLSLSVGRAACDVRLDAEYAVSGGHVFQFRLQGPPRLAIQRVSVLDDDVERVAHWSTDEAGRISVFLTTPLAGRQNLTLLGSWQPPDGSAFVIPRLDCLSADTKSRAVRVYRRPAVLAQVEPTGAVTAQVSEATAENEDDLGSFVGKYLLEGPAAELKVSRHPNTPQSKAVLVAYLDRQGERWLASIDCHLDVSEGVVDSIHFEIPSWWEPATIEGAASFKIVSLPGQSRRELVVLLNKPMAGKHVLTVRGRVTLDRARVPEILPLRMQQVDRFVVLPQRLDAQPVSWETVGLVRADLPAQVEVRDERTAGAATFQVAGENFQASLKAAQRDAAVRITVADLHMAWQSDGNCQVAALFDVQPAGANSVVLELPPGYRLLHASIEKLPAMLVPLANNRWRLALGAQRLPQRIELVCAGKLSGSLTQRQFGAPRLLDVEVERTLWTIYDPPGVGQGRPSDPKMRVPAVNQDLARLKNIASIAQLSPEVVGEHLPDEAMRWYGPWKKRYESARDALDWNLAAARENATQSEAGIEARAFDGQFRAADTRLGNLEPAVHQVALTDSPDAMLAAIQADRHAANYQVSGISNALSLRYPDAALDRLSTRLLAALAIVLATAGAVLYLRHRPFPTFAPWAVLALLGGAWWLLLSPSVVGLAILLIAIATRLQSRWRPAVRPISRRQPA